MKRRTTLILLSLGFGLLVLFFVIWVGQGEVPTVSEGEAGKPRTKLSALTKRLGSALQQRMVEIKPARPEPRSVDPYETWSTEKILSHFGVPPGKFEGASMAEVVEYLKTVYAENGGRGVEFRIEGGEGRSVSCDFGNVTASGLMELVAGLGGYEVQVGKGEVVFRRKAPVPSGGMQEMRLDGSFAQRLFQHSSSEPEDPFGGNVETPIASEFLREFGIEFGDGAAAGLDEQSGEFVINNTAEENDRILAIYSLLMDQLGAGQVLLSTKQVSAQKGSADFATESYLDAEFQQVIRSLSQTEGASLGTTPSVVLTGGQRAKVEIIREYIYPTARDANGEPTAYDVRNVGFTLEVSATLLGLDKIGVVGVVEHTLIGDQTLEQSVRGEGLPDQRVASGEDDFKTLTTGFEGHLFDGNTAGFLSADDGKIGVQQFVTVRRMLPDGQPLFPFE